METESSVLLDLFNDYCAGCDENTIKIEWSCKWINASLISQNRFVHSSLRIENDQFKLYDELLRFHEVSNLAYLRDSLHFTDKFYAGYDGNYDGNGSEKIKTYHYFENSLIAVEKLNIISKGQIPSWVDLASESKEFILCLSIDSHGRYEFKIYLVFDVHNGTYEAVPICSALSEHEADFMSAFPMSHISVSEDGSRYFYGGLTKPIGLHPLSSLITDLKDVPQKHIDLIQNLTWIGFDQIPLGHNTPASLTSYVSI